MSYETLAATIGGTYRQLSPISGFISSPLVMPEDGAMLGAYLIEAAGNRVRITDDANTLYRATLHGVSHSQARAKQIEEIAKRHGMTLSNDGEISVTCMRDDAPYFLARYLEAIDRISFHCLGYRPKASSRFEKRVGQVLEDVYRARLVRAVSLVGASGHPLKFPFMIGAEGTRKSVIQPVAAKEGKVDWAGVYQAVGKFIDLKNSGPSDIKRIAVLEGMEDENIEKAKVALADTATVIVFRQRAQFINALAQAA